MRTLIAVDDPRMTDVRSLLEQHLDFAHAVTPEGHVHALDLDALLDPSVTFYSARCNGQLLAVAALKQLGPRHAELKSMHTGHEARREGVGRELLGHLLSVASRRGCRRVSLETGTMDAFAPARALYEGVGFVPCRPFGAYTDNPHSVCMTIDLTTTEWRAS